MRPRWCSVLVVALLVLAGCSGPLDDGAGRGPSVTTGATSEPAGTGTAPTTATRTTGTATDASGTPGDREYPADDPPSDRIGWEGGYWHNESVGVRRSDGYSRAEVDRLLNRSMARVEVVRGLEFEESVPLEWVAPDDAPGGYVAGADEVDPWMEQFYEATFLVGESNATPAVVGGGRTFGAYLLRGVIHVVGNRSTAPFGELTLAHELTHALQGQRHVNYRAHYLDYEDTMEGRNVAAAPVEGEAQYVTARYRARCGDEWRCVVVPDDGAVNRTDLYGTGERSPRAAADAAALFPYDAGAVFVQERYERGGWEAVADTTDYGGRADGSAEVIHPDRYPDWAPTDVSVREDHGGEWERFANARNHRHTEAGEAWLFVALWASGVAGMEPRTLTLPSGETVRALNYSHPATDGWRGDRFVALRNGTHYAYVWNTTWASPADARQFREAYVDVLEAHGAARVDDGVWRIPEGNRFADAFRVVRRGDSVVVVNAPSVAALDDVRPPGNASAGAALASSR